VRPGPEPLAFFSVLLFLHFASTELTQLYIYDYCNDDVMIMNVVLMMYAMYAF
jgi:hypothetical protein